MTEGEAGMEMEFYWKHTRNLKTTWNLAPHHGESKGFAEMDHKLPKSMATPRWPKHLM